ncbi:MAG: tetratricopeptide repeat protein [Calditrichaceae bacterium]|jgi:Flp pilus assembly protein TadD
MKKILLIVGFGLIFASCAWFKSEPKEEMGEDIRAEEMRLAMADNLVSDGIKYYQAGNDSFAVNAWRKSLDINPYDAEVYNFIGISLHRMDKIEKALEAFQTAVQIRADYYQAYNNVGYMLFLLGRYEDALTAFNTCLTIEPDYEPAVKNKKLTQEVFAGNLSRKAFEIAEEASEEEDALKQIDDYRKVLQIDSTYIMAQNNLGVAYYYEGKMDSAYYHIKKALEINSNYPEGLNNLAYLYKVEENYELAVKLFLKALTLKPKYFAALNNLGETYILMNEMANAERVFTTVLDLDPENEVAKKWYSEITSPN